MKTLTSINNLNNVTNISKISQKNLNLNFNKNNINTVFPSINSSHMNKLVIIKEYQDNLQNTNSNINNDISINKNVQSSLTTLSQYVYDFKNFLPLHNKSSYAYSNIFSSNKKELGNINNVNLNTSSTINKEINNFSLKTLNNKGKKSENKLSFLNLYPNLNDQIKNYGILDLNIKNIKQYINLLSKFKSEININQVQGYTFSKQTNFTNNYIYDILNSCFNPMHSFISKPKIIFSFNKVEIKVFFYVWNSKIKSNSLNNSNFLIINNERLQFVCEKLSKLYNKPIVLELTRLYNPYNESNILANAIGPLGNLTRLSRVRDVLIKKAKIINPTKIYNKRRSLLDILGIVNSSSFLSGIKIRVAGRLLLENVVPRRTVKTFQKGSLARSKANYVKTERFVSKNRRGSYSVTVTIGHGVK